MGTPWHVVFCSLTHQLFIQMSLKAISHCWVTIHSTHNHYCVFCPDFLILTFSRCSSNRSSAMKESVWYPLHFVWKLWSHCRPVIAMQCIFVHIQNLITCTFHDRSTKPTVILQPFFSSPAVINPMIDCGCALMRKAEMHRENSSLMYHIKIWCTAVLFQITLNNSLAFRKWDVHLCRLFTALKLLLFLSHGKNAARLN